MVRVTTANRLIFELQGIVIAVLPQTFHDAVYIARQLGLRYLWVDALCILQDFSDDWARGARIMGQYYKNAFLTKSVLYAHGTEDGFLQPRPLQLTAPLKGTFRIRHSRPSWEQMFR